MFTVAMTSADFQHVCYGIAAILWAWGTVVYARRRDSKSGEPAPPAKLPPME